MFKNINLDEYAIKKIRENSRSYIVVKKSCRDLETVLKAISFNIQNTKLTIHPAGYFDSHDWNADSCELGIESIPNN